MGAFLSMKSDDVIIVFLLTETARPRYIAAGGLNLSDRLPLVPVPGDEIAAGSDVFRVIRRRIDPGPPCRVTLTLDHPAQSRHVR